MTVFTETRRTAAFILGEEAGARSRESGVVASGQDLDAGTILKRLAGKLVEYEGDEDIVVGVLISAVDATTGDRAAAFLARDAEVNRNLLQLPEDPAPAIAGLEALGIQVRDDNAPGDLPENALTLGGQVLVLGA